jgi:hypothetical protein
MIMDGSGPKAAPQGRRRTAAEVWFCHVPRELFPLPFRASIPLMAQIPVFVVAGPVAAAVPRAPGDEAIDRQSIIGDGAVVDGRFDLVLSCPQCQGSGRPGDLCAGGEAAAGACDGRTQAPIRC